MTRRAIAAACARSLFAATITVGLAAAADAAGPRVALETTAGRIVVELDPERAPISSRNFLAYVAERHYDGTVFHRVVEGFVIQGGGMTADLKEKPTRAPIANEAANGLSNAAGTLAMARGAAPDSATSQFYINVADNPRLDHRPERAFGYAVFGRVVDGMDVVERIRHVAVRPVPVGNDLLENVPVDPVVIDRAVLLP